MKTGVPAPIEVKSLFEKRPNFSWVYKATNGSFLKT
ncbi:hypothetical protein BC749_104313 [Flavobacterium araucananum]|nr:hypothetical protein BC749_104313 [Flavobacterium araucananum]